MTDGDEARPTLTVVVPARDAATHLADTLPALAESDLPRERWELVVVDDASEDETPLVAAAYADTVVQLPAPARGPAYARNRGFEVARGAFVAFVDADVRVHGDTLRRLLAGFREAPDVGAVFGSYDDRPAAPGLVSQFRNLMHHHFHQENAGEAETFWAGCGAVRAEVFRLAGMYDEWHYAEPQIEDIELGRRIRRMGYRIFLRPDILATHLKRWTLGGMLRTDFLGRGVPWTRLLIQEGSSGAARALNLRTSEKVATVAVGGGTLAALAAVVGGVGWPLWISLTGLGVVVAGNLRFYGRLARVHGLSFPLACVPLHLLYYLSNCVAAPTGWLVHHLVGGPSPSPAAAAFREMELETWPPAPARPERSLWAKGGPSAVPVSAPPPAAARAGPVTPAAGGEAEEGVPAGAADRGLGDRVAFLPLHKRAFGLATGTAAALVVFVATAHHVLVRPTPAFPLGLLAEFFHGYEVSWRGAFVGAGWAFFAGAVGGWFLAFTRNLVLAASIFGARAREDLTTFRSFLDHL